MTALSGSQSKPPALPEVGDLIGKYEFCLNQNTINIQELIESAITNSEINFTSETLN